MSVLRDALLLVARTKLAAVSLGIIDALVRLPDTAFGVLTYHRVDHAGARPWLYPALLSATPPDFADQMITLKRLFHPVSLADLLAASQGRKPLPPRAVLVTFDDAYVDFAETAWPILRGLEVPVTLFVPTGYPDRSRSFWWDRLWASIAFSSGAATISTHVGPMPLRTDDQKRRTARTLIQYHKTLRHDEAMAGVDALCDLLATPTVEDGPSVLSWDALRALAHEGVCIAPHSRHHPLLTRVSDAAAREEIEGSRADLRAQVPEACTDVFAYPSGSYSDRVISVARDIGIQIAFTTDRGGNRLHRSDPLRLRRINVGPRADTQLIRGQLTLGALQQR